LKQTKTDGMYKPYYTLNNTDLERVDPLNE